METKGGQVRQGRILMTKGRTEGQRQEKRRKMEENRKEEKEITGEFVLEKALELLNWLKNNRQLIGLLAGGMILIFGGWLFLKDGKKEEGIRIISEEGTESGLAADSATGEIVVDVSGAVVRPGVYHLRADSRVQEALAAGGGLSGEADREWVSKNLNLAAKLGDGIKIYIPSKEEIRNSKSEVPNKFQIPNSKSENFGIISAGVVSSEKGGVINLNTASASELAEFLPGIGSSLAQRIIDYRQTHGGFKSVEELLNISGIGEKKFSQIKDKVGL